MPKQNTLPKHSPAHAHCISLSLPRRGVCSDPTRNGASTEIHRTATRCVQQMEKNKMTTTEKHEKSAGLQSTSQRSWYTPPAARQPFQGGDTYYRITLHRIQPAPRNTHRVKMSANNVRNKVNTRACNRTLILRNC